MYGQGLGVDLGAGVVAHRVAVDDLEDPHGAAASPRGAARSDRKPSINRRTPSSTGTRALQPRSSSARDGSPKKRETSYARGGPSTIVAPAPPRWTTPRQRATAVRTASRTRTSPPPCAEDARVSSPATGSPRRRRACVNARPTSPSAPEIRVVSFMSPPVDEPAPAPERTMGPAPLPSRPARRRARAGHPAAPRRPSRRRLRRPRPRPAPAGRGATAGFCPRALEPERRLRADSCETVHDRLPSAGDQPLPGDLG